MKILFGYFFKKTYATIFRKTFIVALMLIGVSTTLLTLNRMGNPYNYNIGDYPKRPITVPVDLVYYVEKETKLAREKVKEEVPLVFEKDNKILTNVLIQTNTIFTNIDSILKEYPLFGTKDYSFQVKTLHEILPEYLKFDKRILRALMSYKNPEELRKIIIRIFNNIYYRGVLDKEYTNPLKLKNTNVMIKPLGESEESQGELKSLDQLITKDELLKKLNPLCRKYTKYLPANQQWAVYIVVKHLISPDIEFNEFATKNMIDRAVKNVKPIMRHLKKDDVVVKANEPITPQAMEKIKIINNYKTNIHYNYIGGIASLQIVFFIIISFFLNRYYHHIFPDKRAPIIVVLLLITFFLFTYFVFKSNRIDPATEVVAFFLPLPFVVMIITIIYNIQLAFLLGFYALFYMNLLNTGDYASFFIGLSSVLISVFGIRKVEKRTDFLRYGFVLGLINSFLVISIGLMAKYSLADVRTNIEYAFISGLINSIAVMGLLPVFEHLFGITTKFKLFELTDLNAPIFKKMLINAPGTYNHSIMVATMSEAACKEIGGNSLLARVGGYYHDIGKLEYADIYIENRANENIKKGISPQDYSKKIISHVEKGVELARKAGLPNDVISFIREHHGDSLMAFFYHQALEQAQKKGHQEIDKEAFQYPGPRPHSKETAVVMLADAIEAATRSIQDPTYVKLETMVKKIIYNKLNEGALEYSDLTMRDLHKIQKSLLRILNGIFHTRIEYPENDEIQKLEKDIKNNDKANKKE